MTGVCAWLGGARGENVLLGVALGTATGGGMAHLLWSVVIQPKLLELDEWLRAFHRFADHGEVDRMPTSNPAGLAPVSEVVAAVIQSVEEGLRRSERAGRVGRSLVRASPNGVMVTDESGKIILLNPAFSSFVSIRGDGLGMRPIEAVPLAEVQQTVDRVLAGETVEGVPCLAGTRDLVVRGVPMREGALVIAMDVTEFKAVERARTDFVANVSHELRTPIASILGYTETLLADPSRLEPSDLRLVEGAHRNGARLRSLFEDLLTLHRIEVRRGDLPLRDENACHLLQNAVISAADQAHQRGLAFVLDCDEAMTVTCSAEALSAIVGNLAANAVAYTREGGTVTVVATELDDEVRIDVRDTGIGIPARHLERIFERFYRVDDGRARRKGGTGLGLAIVKHLARASRCKVTVTSEVDVGSVFTVHVPKK